MKQHVFVTFWCVLVGANIAAALAACNGCSHVPDPVTLAVNAREAGAPFDEAMEACERDAVALDAGAHDKCAFYNECQRRVARQYNMPDSFGYCSDGGK